MIFEILIELENVEPRIWRRVRVDSSIDMRTFHHTIQIAMGWEDCHLYYFNTGEEKITQLEFLDEDDFLEDHEVNLEEFLSDPGDVIHYVYDFGDNWTHKLTLEKAMEESDSPHTPYCTGGERNCPPEDVGGCSGFKNFLTVMADSRLPEHEEMVDWYGGPYDPEELRLEIINEDLENIDDYIDSLDEGWLY